MESNQLNPRVECYQMSQSASQRGAIHIDEWGDKLYLFSIGMAGLSGLWEHIFKFLIHNDAISWVLYISSIFDKVFS